MRRCAKTQNREPCQCLVDHCLVCIWLINKVFSLNKKVEEEAGRAMIYAATMWKESKISWHKHGSYAWSTSWINQDLPRILRYSDNVEFACITNVDDPKTSYYPHNRSTLKAASCGKNPDNLKLSVKQFFHSTHSSLNMHITNCSTGIYPFRITFHEFKSRQSIRTTQTSGTPSNQSPT